ncbi:PREDICTED: geranylgeranyl transferase type-1 subunit beta isoform X1 [Drosophila arizonae]|uniref:Geranylgeranyl transferase type-1 subunit beta n=2 Tax=Drosophila arizonae TaxID=7263 RepID=A0ABM1NU76_DROAR|nr:PREDICTED: geranylgeranyl transferase type-1 subunit beta isoform X1 [Drosophila arizonae]
MSYHIVDMTDPAEPEPVVLAKHAKNLLRFLHLLPARMSSHDDTRSTIVFFAVCGLDVLNSLHLISPELRKDIIDWTYGGLVTPRDHERQCGGFMGCRAMVPKTEDAEVLESMRAYQWGHLAITYTSIAVLVTLGDDLSRLNRQSIVRGVAAVQHEDGSFSASIDGSENDMRFVYCAATICHMLDCWEGVNKDAMFEFIMRSLRYDYGFSQGLEGEAHGGTTFCALAALELSEQLHRLDEVTVERIKRWLVFRQMDGFQGRPNKPVDTCYSFWIGAALCILNSFELTDYAQNREYIMSTENNLIGGFAKWPKSTPDPFHTYLGLCGLAFIGEPGLNAVMPSLNISMAAYKHLNQLHERWKTNNNGLTHELTQLKLTVGSSAEAGTKTTSSSSLISAQ